MLPRDLLAVINAASEKSVVAVAEMLAKRWDAHVSILHLAEGLEPTSARRAGPIWMQMLQEMRAANASEFARIKERATRIKGVELRSAEVVRSSVEALVAQHAMYANMTLMQQPETEVARGAFEAVLFGSGRPVLLLPPEWSGQEIGKRVLLAWKAKREAVRAQADAWPFLSQAERIWVTTVDARPNGEGAAPGRDITRHLARHGLKVELRNVDGLGRASAAVLMDEARELGADLIVMGGYGHSRLRQFVFGGVTRALIAASPVPLLLSH